MTTTTNGSSRGNHLITIVVISVLAGLLIFAWLGGVALPVITDDRGAFFALAILGFGLCAFGAGSDVRMSKWGRSPSSIIGIILGILSLGLIGAQLFNIELPLAATAREAFVALALIIAIKWTVGRVMQLRAQENN